MKRQDKFEFTNKALWFPVERVLAVADLHIGHEEAMNKAGIFFPRIQFSQIVSDLEKIFKKTGKIKEIIINGDLKHEFGTISLQEWDETLKILELMLENSEKVVLVKGNHDKILEPIARKGGVEIVDYYIKNEVCFMHGDKLFLEGLDKKIKTLVLGHRHPAVSISDKYKKERYKCFLAGKWKGKEIIILPSFFPLVEGTDIVNVREIRDFPEHPKNPANKPKGFSDVEENNLLFIPEKDLKNFEVYAVGEEVYRMGKLRDAGEFGN